MEVGSNRESTVVDTNFHICYAIKSSFRFSCAACARICNGIVRRARYGEISKISNYNVSRRAPHTVKGKFLQKSLKRTVNSMAKKLYVGGVPYSSTDADLKAHFEQSGPVASATIIMDKMTGRSKGFGFVEMENDADADAAIDKFNNQDFQGRKLTVSEARPQERRF